LQGEFRTVALVMCEWKSHSRHIDSQEQWRMQSEVRQLTAEEILSEYHRKLLSPNAVRLYVAVWFRMGSRNATEIWLTDEDASCRARILLQDIPAAQSELAKARLMEIVPGDGQTRYTFVDDPEHAGNSTLNGI
jgi:hypothetical protein